MNSNLILFNPKRFAIATEGLNTEFLVPITEEQIKLVFYPLGAQDDEIPEITADLGNALDSLDKDYVQSNPDIADTLLEKISELSDTTRRYHAPYELILNAIQDNPEAIKRICSMSSSDSPRAVLNEILSSSFLDEETDDEDDQGYRIAM